MVQDHCNGLILLHSYMANPATGWFAACLASMAKATTVFPPECLPCIRPHCVSSHYNVFIVNYAPLYREEESLDRPVGGAAIHLLSRKQTLYVHCHN